MLNYVVSYLRFLGEVLGNYLRSAFNDEYHDRTISVALHLLVLDGGGPRSFLSAFLFFFFRLS